MLLEFGLANNSCNISWGGRPPWNAVDGILDPIYDFSVTAAEFLSLQAHVFWPNKSSRKCILKFLARKQRDPQL